MSVSTSSLTCMTQMMDEEEFTSVPWFVLFPLKFNFSRFKIYLQNVFCAITTAATVKEVNERRDIDSQGLFVQHYKWNVLQFSCDKRCHSASRLPSVMSGERLASIELQRPWLGLSSFHMRSACGPCGRETDNTHGLARPLQFSSVATLPSAAAKPIMNLTLWKSRNKSYSGDESCFPIPKITDIILIDRAPSVAVLLLIVHSASVTQVYLWLTKLVIFYTYPCLK